MQAGERTNEEGGIDEGETSEALVKRETAKETTRRAYEQVEKALAVIDDSEPDLEVATEEKPRNIAPPREEKVSRGKRREVVIPDKGRVSKPVQATIKPVQTEVELDYPPSRLNLQEKEAYNSVPAQMRPAFKRMVKEHEEKLFQATRDVSAEREEIRGLKEAVYPFAKDWADRGFSLTQGMVSLACAQEKLTNEKTKHSAARQLLQDLGIKPEELMEGAQGVQNGQYGDISSHPVINQLTQKVDYYENERKQREVYVAQQRQAAEQKVADDIVTQVGSLREEKDRNGKYLYPMLHDPNTLQRITPLLIQLSEAIPGASWDTLAKEAYRIIQLRNGTPTNIPASSPPAIVQQPIQNRARASTVSVRGRAGADSGPEPVDREAFRGLSIKDTMRLVYDQLEREG